MSEGKMIRGDEKDPKRQQITQGAQQVQQRCDHLSINHKSFVHSGAQGG